MSMKADITVEMGLFGGASKMVHYYVVTGPVITLTAAATDAATSLSVQPLKQAIDSGAKIRFGMIPGVTAGMVVTLSAAAKYGATSISVTAISGYLQHGQTGQQCQNITGWTAVDSFYTDLSATAVHTETASISSATEGDFTISFTTTETGTTLTPGETYSHRFRRTNSGSEDVLAYGSVAVRE